MTAIPTGESESNRTGGRNRWAASAHDTATRSLIERDARTFLRRSASSPGMNAVAGAQGAYMSFKISMGSVLSWTPPLVVSEAELKRARETLDACFGEAVHGAGR